MALSRYKGDMSDWTFKQSTLSKEISRVNRNRIILAVSVFFLLFYFDFMSTIYRSRIYYGGPEPITHEEISVITDPETQLVNFGFSSNMEKSDVYTDNPVLKRLMYSKDGTCYVSLTPETVVDSGIQAYTTSGGETGVEYVLGRLTTGKYLFIKRSSVVRLEKAEGTIGYLPPDLRTEVLNASDVNDADLLPLIMDATGETFESISTIIWFSVMIFILWCLWFFFIVRRAFNISRDPAYKRLFMCFGSVEDNARLIDEELASPDVFSSGRVTVTESWRLSRRFFSFMVEPKSSAEK